MKRTGLSLMAGVALAALLCGPTPALAQSAPPMGTLTGFAVLGASTVTNTGASSLTGDLGLSPGTSVTGFPPGVLIGTPHVADGVAGTAQTDLTAAYTNLAGQACTQDLTGQDLGGKTLTPGVYCFSTSAQLTGTLTLNAQGNSAAIFIFKIGSTLTTASSSSVVVINAASLCNIFWQVGSSATLGTTTSFAGNILAQDSITLNTGANTTGRLLARTGAVTLDTNSVTTACTAGSCPTITLSPASLPGGTTGVAYSQTITGSGGTAPYTFAVTSGSLPAGLSLSSAGVLSGTPTANGSSTFTVRGTAADGCFGTRSYTINIGCPTITLAPATLPGGTTGVAYSQTITGSGGTAPYTFAVTSGSLPAGLTLTSAGVLAGTPTTPGSSTFTIRGTDANGCFASLSYTIVMISPVPTLPQWGAALLAAGLLGLGYLRQRCRSSGAA